MTTTNKNLPIGILFVISFLFVSPANAQTSKKEIFNDIYRTGSNYFAYPGPKAKKLTKAPEGYTPFYISHYGRHGSRYMSSNEYYVTAINKLDSAAQFGILSAKGQEVLEKLRIGYADAWHRDGDLSKLGARQHREIAHRMFERFPELLSQPLKVDAKSSTVRRCMLSMFNFCQELQALNPQLDIAMDASKHDWNWVVEDLTIQPAVTPASEAYEQQRSAIFESAHNPTRLMASLFTDVQKATTFINGRDLMEALYNVAEDLQNIPELNIELINVFTKEELFNMWQGYNAGWLLNTGLVPGCTPYYEQQREVLDSIVSIADQVILKGEPTATLRFSHDSSVLPLAYLLGLKEARSGKADIPNIYKYISIDKIIPMAANIQIIFYRPLPTSSKERSACGKINPDEVLVKFLLNENETTLPEVKTDCAPYYHWRDLRAYYRKN
jgi:hypothetical protein